MDEATGLFQACSTVNRASTCHTNCSSECLCSLLPDGTGSGGADARIITPALDVDEIYQVLGRDILKSSLLDDNIDLYLECDDDNCYVVPPTTTILPAQQPPIADLSESILLCDSRSRISFPQKTESYLPTRFKCSKCSRSFTRESLLKDHLFKVHAVVNLFPCPHCGYKGQTHRLLAKHSRRKHNETDKKGNRDGVEIIAERANNGLVNERTDEQTDQKDVHEKGTVLHEHQDEMLVMRDNNLALTPRDWSVEVHKTVYVEVICTNGVPGETIADTCHGKTTVSANEDEDSAGNACTTSRHNRYACTWPGCKQTARDRFNLDLHFRTHSGAPRLRCEICSYTCIQKSSMNWHRQKKHYTMS